MFLVKKQPEKKKRHLIPNGSSLLFQKAQNLTNLPRQRQAADVENWVRRLAQIFFQNFLNSAVKAVLDSWGGKTAPCRQGQGLLKPFFESESWTNTTLMFPLPWVNWSLGKFKSRVSDQGIYFMQGRDSLSIKLLLNFLLESFLFKV